MQSAADHYLAQRVNTASPAELTAMLYDALCANIRGAIARIEAGAPLEATPKLIKAQDILLDALEARTGLLEHALGAGADDVVLPDLELAADGPLPRALRLRAQVLLARTRRLEHELARRTGAAARARAAYASH